MNMTKLQDVLAEGSKYEISLTKLMGVGIKDLQGYVSGEFGEATFKLSKLVLDNGCVIQVEGEHDFPYLTPYEDAPAGIQSDSLADLLKQER